MQQHLRSELVASQSSQRQKYAHFMTRRSKKYAPLAVNQASEIQDSRSNHLLLGVADSRQSRNPICGP